MLSHKIAQEKIDLSDKNLKKKFFLSLKRNFISGTIFRETILRIDFANWQMEKIEQQKAVTMGDIWNNFLKMGFFLSVKSGERKAVIIENIIFWFFNKNRK